MPARTLHVHMPRIGLALPARTVRPYPRRGDRVLSGFFSAVAEPADRVVITGRLFDRVNPPAHLVDRVVGRLGDLVSGGVAVRVPGDTPRALLFLAAGVGLGETPDANGAPEFWRGGSYRVFVGEREVRRRVRLPGVREVRIDVTGRGASDVIERIHRLLRSATSARSVRLVLTGDTREPEILGFGPREVLQHLPGGVDGAVANETRSLHAEEGAALDDEARVAALARVRAGLPELPETTGVYEFRDGEGRALYVGKAVNMRRRVASHFTAEARAPSPRGPMLLATRTVSIVEHAGEVEALLAEAARIREARPPYNRRMREPEGYRYLRVDRREAYPTLSSTDRVRRDGARYVGPFAKRWVVERALRTLQVVYGLRSCAWREGERAPDTCTDRDLGICSSPCAEPADRSAYRRRVRLALDHLFSRPGSEPPFGWLNAPSTGLLSAEDLSILGDLVRRARWLLEGLSEANGLLPLPGGRVLLVLGGLRAGVRQAADGTIAEVRRWARRRIEAFRRRRPRTWVRPEQAEEVRILSGALRRQGNGFLTASRGMDSA